MSGDKGPKGNDGCTPRKNIDYWTNADKEEIIEDVLESSEFQNIVDDITNLEENKAEISDITNTINTHNTSDLAHSDIRQTADEAKAIARGKSESRTFDTTADLIDWISDVTNKNVLKVGDNLYDKTNGVPDYWISEVLEEPNEEGYYYGISPLDAETPDLSNMMTTNTAQTISGNKNFTRELKKNGIDVATIEDIPTEDIEDLYNQIPTAEVINTTISITDSSNLQIRNAELEGNSNQEIRDDKNKLNYTTVTNAPATNTTLIENGFKVVGQYAGKITITGLTANTDYTLQYIRENIIGTTKVVTVFAGTSQSTILSSFTTDNGGTFNTDSNTTINIWFYCAMGSQGEVDFTNIQLEEGTVPTQYQPYGVMPSDNYPSQITNVTGNVTVTVSNSSNLQAITIPLGNIELCRLQNGVKDRIYKSNKWYLDKNINAETVSGLSATITSAKDNSYFICTHKIASQLDGKVITFDTSVANAVVQYELATPITTEITDTALINALEQLLSIKTFKNITNIVNDKNAYLDIIYYKDIEEALENAGRVKDVKVDNVSVVDEEGIANIETPEIPTKTSDLTNDIGFIDKNVNDLTNYTLAVDIANVLLQKLSTKPDGTNFLIENGKIATGYLPDVLIGQVLYGGNFTPNTAVAELTEDAKTRLGTTSNTIVLTDDDTPITGYTSNQGIFYIASEDGVFAGINLVVGDWLISLGSAWNKVDNTDAVASVNGKIGVVILNISDLIDDSDTSPIKRAIADQNGNVIDSSYLKLTGGTINGNIASQSITPKTSNTYSLGSSTNYFQNLYVKSINAYLAGELRSQNQTKFYWDNTSFYPNGTNIFSLGKGNSIYAYIYGKEIIAGQQGSVKGDVKFYNSDNNYQVVLESLTPTASRTLYLPDRTGTLDTVNKKKTITEASSNIAVSGTAPNLVVTITDADIKTTTDIQLYPNNAETETWLQENLSNSIITETNGSFTFSIKAMLPTTYSFYYIISEVI